MKLAKRIVFIVQHPCAWPRPRSGRCFPAAVPGIFLHVNSFSFRTAEEANMKLKAHLAWSNDKPMRTLGYKPPRQMLLEKLTDDHRP